MRLRILVALGASVLLAGGLSLSAVEQVRVQAVHGEVKSYAQEADAGKVVAEGDYLVQGDSLVVARDAFVSVVFPDGGRLDVSGPAHVRLRLLQDNARTIELVYGTISRLIARDVATGVITACDVFVSFRNGSLFMRTDTSGEPYRVTVKLFEGENAVVGQGTQSGPLTTEKPEVFECSSCCPQPVPEYVPAVWLPPVPPVHWREIYDDPIKDPPDSSFMGHRR